MAVTDTLRHYRNIHTGEIIHVFQRPSLYDWEVVEVDFVNGGWRTVEEATPRPDDEDERLANVPIKGYRQLSALELELTNKVKMHAEATRRLIEELKYASSEQDGPNEPFEMDMRWAAIATTDLQTGYMALVRSITRPETF